MKAFLSITLALLAVLAMGCVAQGDGALAQVKAERWHFCAHLRDTNGRRYDVSVMFFRYRFPGADAFYPAAVAITSESDGRRFAATRVEREADGLGKSTRDGKDVRVGDLTLQETTASAWRRFHLRLHASADDAALDLVTRALKPPTSYGSSSDAYTRLAASGRLKVKRATSAVSGTAWFEHDVGADVPVSLDERWDLFEITLDDGRDVMLRFHGRGTLRSLVLGRIVLRSGKVIPLRSEDVMIENPLHTSWISARTGARYPSLWEIIIPKAHLDEALIPPLQQNEIVSDQSGSAFYDAPVDAERAPAPGGDFGAGFVEETGYAPALDTAAGH